MSIWGNQSGTCSLRWWVISVVEEVSLDDDVLFVMLSLWQWGSNEECQCKFLDKEAEWGFFGRCWCSQGRWELKLLQNDGKELKNNVHFKKTVHFNCLLTVLIIIKRKKNVWISIKFMQRVTVLLTLFLIKFNFNTKILQIATIKVNVHRLKELNSFLVEGQKGQKQCEQYLEVLKSAHHSSGLLYSPSRGLWFLPPGAPQRGPADTSSLRL